LASIPIALFFKVGPKGWGASSALADWFPTLPFLDQMGLTALLSMLVIVIVSRQENRSGDDVKGIPLEKGIFATPAVFNVGAFALLLITAALYALFW